MKQSEWSGESQLPSCDFRWLSLEPTGPQDDLKEKGEQDILYFSVEHET